jgi:arsenite/tail-anchored protein-transporting ATPase
MRVVLFTGKGGVGTTTLAAATAAHLARSGRKTLVLSVDPSHSLCAALEADLGGEATEIDGALYAAQVDPRALLEGCWTRLQEHLPRLTGAGSDELLADELTVLPGVEELLALREVRRAAETGPWDAVVVDCGPTSDTLRLLALPEAVGTYLDRLFPAHRRAVRGLLPGPTGPGAPSEERAEAALQRDRTMDALDALAAELAGVRAVLGSPRTSVRLVLTPERLVAAETRRTLTALALHGQHVDGLLANRVLPTPPPDGTGSGAVVDPATHWLRHRGAEQAAVLADLAALDVPVRTVAHAAAEPTGVAALLALADELFDGDDPAAEPGPAAPLLAVRRTAGTGTSAESEFELCLHLPGVGAGALDLARVGDELAVTAAGVRRLLVLPAVLRRCTATRARLEGDDLRVTFRPDPEQWIR